MTPLELYIIQRALAGSLLSGLLAGLVGVLVTRMKLTSSGFCLSHAAFAGAALGVALSVNPLALALAFSALVASVIGPVADRARLHPDIIMSIAFPLNMALAFIFITLAPVVTLATGELTTILWGSVLAVSSVDIAILLAVLSATAALLFLFWKEFYAIMFDRKMAEADGVNTRAFVYLAIFIVGVVVTLSMKLVGGLLVFALLVNPASTALQLLYDLKKVAVASPLIGASTCAAGLALSLLLNWPVGACITLTSTLCFAASVALSPKRRRLAQQPQGGVVH